ncbi:TDP-N-acetylfucosamine:lipid II N-acetylfucosaminyltransferase [Vibrio sp. T20]|uniref:TDP-N-acetylfucosamine:lipid II N-acetylfucosaminyltransferase n=1 Tax=Vibrio sp. T20 TaxID=2588450 RepID=UPI0011B43B94|nr:TDP-N-acetylfucosamine:lipid II N-acetylfucosaminyltransferase [Vibrio sp. T20]
MILHIAPDEKFIDIAFRLFEEVNPGGNKLVVITKSEELRYIKKSEFIRLSPEELERKDFNIYFKGVIAVVFHSLAHHNVKVPAGIKTLWIGFGYDYYDLIYSDSDELLLNQTRKLKWSLNKIGFLKNKLKKVPLLKVTNNIFKGVTSKINTVNKMDYFSPVLNSEYQLVKQSVSKFAPGFIDWNYGTLEDDLLRGFKDRKVFGNNILIGNSASFTNNHLEAFDLLTTLDIKNRDLVCPLSYGDLHYRNSISAIGEKLFTDRFNSLTDFMPIEDYINILASCSVVIMNHTRQQALGNIIIMLYLGAKVFLRKKNPVYDFFKDEGAVIFSIEDLELNPNLLHYEITDKDLAVNRQVLRKHWSRENIKFKTKELIRIITTK